MANSTSLLLVAFFVLFGPVAAQGVGLARVGEGGCGSGFVPTFHTAGEPPLLGNLGFRLHAENVMGGARGLVWVSRRSTAIPFHDLMIYSDPTQGFSQFWRADGRGGVAGDGLALMPLRIPMVPALVGLRASLQGFFFDPSRLLTLVHTQGLDLEVRLSIAPETWVVRDRAKYQAFFAGALPTFARQLGRTLWVANQASGFTYVDTVEFTVGGQSHWIVVVRHDLTGIEFSLIPGGSFRMGDLGGTGAPAELPARWVRLAPFLMARTEVTQAQFFALMQSSPWQGQGQVKTGADHAASYITWNDAGGFVGRAGLRLPTEAEWEYACRGGVERCFHFGEDYPPLNLDSYAWYRGNTQGANPPAAHAQPVGLKAPNAFGLHDMHGNVLEWCQDSWHADYLCAPIDGGAWVGPAPDRILRGGSWEDLPTACRSAARLSGATDVAGHAHGFRPACSL